jgi:hypothetical protein
LEADIDNKIDDEGDDTSRIGVLEEIEGNRITLRREFRKKGY